MRKSKLLYIIMAGTGLVLTLSLIASIWTNDNVTIILNIVAMIGSGVLCSALVALFTELRDERLIKAEYNRQRKYIFASLKNTLRNILIFEIKNLSAYSLLIEPNKKTNKHNFSIAEAVEKIIFFLSQMNSIQNIDQIDFIIDSHYLDRIKARNAFTYELTLPYYKSLLNAIASIIAESNNFLICGVLNENQIETLKDWQWEINPIIEHSKESTLELLLDFKTLFFKNIYKYLDVLDFDKNEQLNCYIVEKV